MGEHTKIEWCQHTFNPWIGCTKVSPARTSPANWEKVKTWNRKAACVKSFDCNAGDHADCCPQKNPPRVFCASLADVFEDWDGPVLDHKGDKAIIKESFGDKAAGYRPMTLDDVRRDLWQLIEETPNLTWLLLTKRPENVERMVPASWLESWPQHVWPGVSVEDQKTANERIWRLLSIPGVPVRFVSYEPALGPVDFTEWLFSSSYCKYCQQGNQGCVYCGGTGVEEDTHERLNWLIAGGESGPNARPSHPDYFRSARDQCVAAGVPFFMKQVTQDGRKVPFEEWPDDLKVREIPCLTKIR